jgi:hypothetical protein
VANIPASGIELMAKQTRFPAAIASATILFAGHFGSGYLSFVGVAGRFVLSELRFRFHPTPSMSICPETARHRLLWSRQLMRASHEYAGVSGERSCAGWFLEVFDELKKHLFFLSVQLAGTIGGTSTAASSRNSLLGWP